MMGQCELREWAMLNGYGPCGGGMDRHHIVSRNMLKGNKSARKFVDGFEPAHVFIADVCNYHNAQTKAADLPEARRLLLQNRVALYGYDYMSDVWKDLASLFKAFPPEWELHRLLSAPQGR